MRWTVSNSLLKPSMNVFLHLMIRMFFLLWPFLTCFSCLRASYLTRFSLHFLSSWRNPRVGSPKRPSTVRPNVGFRRSRMEFCGPSISSRAYWREFNWLLTVDVGVLLVEEGGDLGVLRFCCAWLRSSPSFSEASVVRVASGLRMLSIMLCIGLGVPGLLGGGGGCALRDVEDKCRLCDRGRIALWMVDLW